MRRILPFRLLAAVMLGHAALLPVYAQPDAASLEFFESKIRPLLAQRCFECHGPDKAKNGLRLDHISTALPGGQRGPAINRQQPEKSLLLEAIGYGNPDLQMPPKGMLPESEKQLLRRWIEMGAPWPNEPAPKAGESKEEVFDLQARKASHWAWQPVQPVQPPQVHDAQWPINEIDRFILASLEAKGITPAPEADRATWLRRVSFVLTGLPPTPEQVRTFAADASPDAHEKVVDTLLRSPKFGERWARHWMDLVRYAETYGHEFDFPVTGPWKYRDYLIRAFNADVPYDQFLLEHMAGDLLPQPRRNPTDGTNESVIATAHWFFHEQSHAPTDALLHEADRIDNQIDVFSKTFQAMTIACARCHDHKFDAISTADYYALAGFLKSSRRNIALLDPQEKIADSRERISTLGREADELVRAALANPAAGNDPQTLARYLQAADQLMNEDLQEVFEDFEGNTYESWEVTGTAFGSGPRNQKELARYQGDVGAQGKGFVNSHDTRNGEDTTKGDAHTGMMMSRPFRIERPFIELLVGGGSDRYKTCVNLLTNDGVVRFVTGQNDNRMRKQRIDVREFIGQMARLQIVDLGTGGWGNIGVDHIVFRGPRQDDAAIERLAAAHQLDAQRLERFVRAMATEGRPAESTQTVATDADRVLFEDFSNGYADWFADGFAFTDQPLRRDSWADLTRGRLDSPTGVAHSGLLGKRMLGSLRSQTFTITHPQMFVRLAGEGSKFRVVVDSVTTNEFSDLLFKGLLFDVNTEGQWRWHTIAQDLKMYLGHRAHIELLDEGDGWIAVDQIWFGNTPPDQKDSTQAAADADAISAETHLAYLLRHDLLAFAPDVRDRLAQIDQELRRLDAELPTPEKVIAMTDGTGQSNHIYIRGSHRSLGREVPRRYMEAIEGEDSPSYTSRGSGRLQLAQSLLDERNPLTARTIVNRLWQHVFSEGIVPTVDNFGVLGQEPTHPQLLDWLAADIRREGWSMKAMLRKMVLSRTFRMQSTPADSHAEQADPTNALLHRMRVKRLEGEAIRDSVLAISGRLDETMFGPSVPIHLTEFMDGRGRPKDSGPLDGNGRRSVYIEVRRNFLSPMMLAFDTPVPFSTFGRRSISNVPAQALILMNDPFIWEQAGLWAQRVRTDESLPTTEQKIQHMYQQAFARAATEKELQSAMRFLREQVEQQDTGSAEMREQAAWTDLAHILINVKEFVFIP